MTEKQTSSKRRATKHEKGLLTAAKAAPIGASFESIVKGYYDALPKKQAAALTDERKEKMRIGRETRLAERLKAKEGKPKEAKTKEAKPKKEKTGEKTGEKK